MCPWMNGGFAEFSDFWQSFSLRECDAPLWTSSLILYLEKTRYLHHYAQLVLKAIGTVCEISEITALL